MDAESTIFTRRWRLKQWQGLVLMLGMSLLAGGQTSQPGAPIAMNHRAASNFDKRENARMWMTVGDRRFAMTLADTEAARAFEAQLPLKLKMAELNGNEKHADLPQALPSDASRPGTIRNGDVMLYGSSTLVVFYETFRSSYAYTRVGRINNPANLNHALGRNEIQVVFARDGDR